MLSEPLTRLYDTGKFCVSLSKKAVFPDDAGTHCPLPPRPQERSVYILHQGRTDKREEDPPQPAIIGQNQIFLYVVAGDKANIDHEDRTANSLRSLN